MFTGMTSPELERALAALGELLAAEGERQAIVVVGGATLNLLGLVPRLTSDVDVIARAFQAEDGQWQLESPEPFPDALQRAIRTVARDLGLAPGWMNHEVGAQWTQGLPPRLLEDTTWRNYGGGLDVGLVGRRTLIALKLHAAADRHPGSVHTQDLTAPRPTDGELRDASVWVRAQDVAGEWPQLIDQVIAHVQNNRP